MHHPGITCRGTVRSCLDDEDANQILSVVPDKRAARARRSGIHNPREKHEAPRPTVSPSQFRRGI
jgi:hypothetical protein